MPSHLIRMTGLAILIVSASLPGCQSLQKPTSLDYGKTGVGPGKSARRSLAAVPDTASPRTRSAESANQKQKLAVSSDPNEGDSTSAKAVRPISWEEPPAPTSETAATEIPGLFQPADDRPLLLDELQQLALAGNPTLRQASSMLEQAQGNWLQVGLYPNPVAGYDGTGNNSAFDQQGAFLSQNIVTANKLQLNRAVAAHDVERARWDVETQTLRVINEIQIRYVAALAAQKQVAVAEDLVQVAEEGVRISEQLREGEAVSKADVLQARLQLSQTQILLKNARFHVEATWKQLGNVIGWPDLPHRPLDGSLTDDVPEIEWESAWSQTLFNSPQLHAAQSRMDAALVQVQREKVQQIPDLRVSGNAWYDTISPPTLMLGLNVGVAMPIFDRNQGNVTAAIGQLNAARAEVARLELVLRDRLAQAFARYESARNQVRTYKETILPTAEENLSLTLKNYEEGEFDFLRVLTARRYLFDANVNYVTSLAELKTAAIEIHGMLLTGGLEPLESNPTPANQAGQTGGPGI